MNRGYTLSTSDPETNSSKKCTLSWWFNELLPLALLLWICCHKSSPNFKLHTKTIFSSFSLLLSLHWSFYVKYLLFSLLSNPLQKLSSKYDFTWYIDFGLVLFSKCDMWILSCRRCLASSSRNSWNNMWLNSFCLDNKVWLYWMDAFLLW